MRVQSFKVLLEIQKIQRKKKARKKKTKPLLWTTDSHRRHGQICTSLVVSGLSTSPHIWSLRCSYKNSKRLSLPLSNVFSQKDCLDTFCFLKPTLSFKTQLKFSLFMKLHLEHNLLRFNFSWFVFVKQTYCMILQHLPLYLKNNLLT